MENELVLHPVEPALLQVTISHLTMCNSSAQHMEGWEPRNLRNTSGRNGNSPSEKGCHQSLYGHPCQVCTNPHLGAKAPDPSQEKLHTQLANCPIGWPSNSDNVLLSVEKGSSWALSSCQSRWPLRRQATLVTDKANSLLPLQSSNHRQLRPCTVPP